MAFALSRRGLIAAAGGAAATAVFPAGAQAKSAPLVYAHRGCSALRPEHTLGAYAKAIQDGADLIEPDLVITKDGVLVARHENNISDTTDVAAHPEFADRRTRKTVYGQAQEGWFTEDFTLAELKTLRAVERLKAGRRESHGYDGQFQILTFDEVIDFVAAEGAARGRLIGIAPEIKNGAYFSGIGLPPLARFIDRLGRHPYTARAPVHVQSFETADLKALRGRYVRGGNVRLVQLIMKLDFVPPDIAAAGGKTTYAELYEPAGLRSIASYADVLAPYTRDVIPLGLDGKLGKPTSVVADAHAAGMQVVAWTFSPENLAIAADFRSGEDGDERNPEGSVAEMRRYIATGIDGFFTDDPGLGRRAVASAMAGA